MDRRQITCGSTPTRGEFATNTTKMTQPKLNKLTVHLPRQHYDVPTALDIVIDEGLASEVVAVTTSLKRIYIHLKTSDAKTQLLQKPEFTDSFGFKPLVVTAQGIPVEATLDQVRSLFNMWGKTEKIAPVIKNYKQIKYRNGNWHVTFSKLNKELPKNINIGHRTLGQLTVTLAFNADEMNKMVTRNQKSNETRSTAPCNSTRGDGTMVVSKMPTPAAPVRIPAGSTSSASDVDLATSEMSLSGGETEYEKTNVTSVRSKTSTQFQPKEIQALIPSVKVVLKGTSTTLSNRFQNQQPTKKTVESVNKPQVNSPKKPNTRSQEAAKSENAKLTEPQVKSKTFLLELHQGKTIKLINESRKKTVISLDKCPTHSIRVNYHEYQKQGREIFTRSESIREWKPAFETRCYLGEAAWIYLLNLQEWSHLQQLISDIRARELNIQFNDIPRLVETIKQQAALYRKTNKTNIKHRSINMETEMRYMINLACKKRDDPTPITPDRCCWDIWRHHPELFYNSSN